MINDATRSKRDATNIREARRTFTSQSNVGLVKVLEVLGGKDTIGTCSNGPCVS